MSPARYQINKYIIPDFAKSIKQEGRVLFVGVDTKWDYRTYFPDCTYDTMDIKEEMKPDIVGDITSCPQIDDETYDGVILIGVWEYVKEKEKMFSEIYRILKYGGKFLACLPGEAYYDDPEKCFYINSDIDIFTGFYINNIRFTYYRTHVPYYYHIFANK